MKYISSRIAGYTLLYVLIIFLIFFVQFKKGTSYRYKNAHMQVSCRIFTNEKKEKEVLLPLHITSNGLLISVTAEEPIKFKMKDGKIQNARILSYKENGNEFLLFLNDGVSLSFARKDKLNKQFTCESLYIVCNLSKKVQEVYIPYKLTQRARIEKQGNSILVQYKGKSFAFSKEQAGLLGQEESEPFIAFSKKNPSIYYQEQLQEEGNELEKALRSNFASAELYKKNLSHFRELAHLFLEKEAKEKKGNEDSIASLFSEYIRKNAYQKALSLYPPMSVPKNRRTMRTAIFYGNLIETYEKTDKQNEKLLNLIYSQLNSQVDNKADDKSNNTETSIFAHPSWQRQNLFLFLFNRGRNDLIEALFEECEKTVANEGSASLYELANILKFCMEYEQNTFFTKDSKPISKKCEEIIYKHLFAINDKLYISTEEKEIDTFSTFYLATTLLEYAEFEVNEELKKIGYLLFNSLYTFTDNPSSFPSVFKIKSDATKKGLIAIDAKIIRTETLYEIFFPKDSCFAYEVKLSSTDSSSPSKEETIFATTIANDLKLRKLKNKVLLEFYFQKGAIHYAVVEGIEPFTNVRIYDKLGYKTDTRFENFVVAGYVYKKDKKRLYLKIDNRSEKEVIELIY